MFEVVVQSEKVIFPNGMVWNLICYELVIELRTNWLQIIPLYVTQYSILHSRPDI